MQLVSHVSFAILASAVAYGAAQPAGTSKTLSGTVRVVTSQGGHAVAVRGESADKAQGPFMFCIDKAPSAGGGALQFSGPATVTYRPEANDLPAGVVIQGPEQVASTLTVAADDGRVWHFVAKGEKPLVAAAGAKATTVEARLVRRVDWQPARGPRRGIDVEECVAAGG